jgi:energy-coupling factor transporter transmembrane protein EcfT
MFDQLTDSPSRYFGYSITVASLCIVFILILLYLIYNRRLLPSIVLIGGFILFVLWLVALIVISIQLWGGSGVSSNCNLAVSDQNPRGQTLETLAWLEQKSICQQWQAVFAFALVGEVFLLWICVMAYQVFADDS